MKVYKYDIPMPNEDSLSEVWFPEGAEPVSVGLQNDKMVLWARLNGSGGRNKPNWFYVVNTGVEFPYCEGRLLGTLTSSTGTVWHVFLYE